MKKTKANMVMGVSPAHDRDWQAEDDLRALQRACEIKADPKRHAAAKRLAKQKLGELEDISAGKK